MCELELELIIKITAYTDQEVSFKHHFHQEQRILASSDFSIKAGCTGMSIILLPFTAKYTHSSSDTLTSAKVKNTITYNSRLIIKDIKDITEQSMALAKHSYNLLVETMSGHQYWIRSTPDTFLYQHTQEAGEYHSTITIENISGSQLILD